MENKKIYNAPVINTVAVSAKDILTVSDDNVILGEDTLINVQGFFGSVNA